MEFELQTGTQIRTASRKKLFFCGIVVAIIVFFVGFTVGYLAFNRSQSKPKPDAVHILGDKKKQEIQEKFLRNVDSEKLGETLR